MTCREKLAIEHPGRSIDQICPRNYGYLKDPEQCKGGSSDYCDFCWDREIPEPEEKKPLVYAFTPPFPEKFEKPVIKDSGNRREFDTGAVRDMQEGKGRCDLMPLGVIATLMNDNPMLHELRMFLDSMDTNCLYRCLKEFSKHYDDFKTKPGQIEILNQRYCTMFLEVAKHFEEGAKKYGENNWQKGIPPKCYIDSAVRHYLKWLRGDKDEPHDRAFVWNLMCCIWEVDYRPKEEKDV